MIKYKSKKCYLFYKLSCMCDNIWKITWIFHKNFLILRTSNKWFYNQKQTSYFLSLNIQYLCQHYFKLLNLVISYQFFVFLSSQKNFKLRNIL